MPIHAEPGSKEQDIPDVTKRLEKVMSLRIRMEERWRHAVKAQAKYYDDKHKPQSYCKGQWVLLSSKNIRFRSGKLTEKFIGPFRIEESIGNQAYKLKLPPLYEKLHPVFHVSLLEPYHTRPGEMPEEWQGPELAEDDEEEEWEVEAILDRRKTDRKVEYLVHWKGWPRAYDQWEPKNPNLKNAADLLEKFDKEFNARERQEAKEAMQKPSLRGNEDVELRFKKQPIATQHDGTSRSERSRNRTSDLSKFDSEFKA
jgi:hypothetical protein